MRSHTPLCQPVSMSQNNPLSGGKYKVQTTERFGLKFCPEMAHFLVDYMKASLCHNSQDVRSSVLAEITLSKNNF